MVLAIHWNQRKTLVRTDRYSLFSKVHFISLLLQEKIKSTNNVQHVFCSEPFLTEAAHILSSESCTIKFLMGTTLSISASSLLPEL